ncbi:OLC1v1035471C1 [Oldenlandia corymbosa var. corymbosa]|uniref:OLC1v1035471C1 n=1 Tax=Oldenlandia corymbosa var. corymbosa TaxID=529605 RepID=A0AAV1CTS0_OLDCO|nr:OLC1v1035471C1 [Oldenlandia corymbosa var. corymbosa]
MEEVKKRTEGLQCSGIQQEILDTKEGSVRSSQHEGIHKEPNSTGSPVNTRDSDGEMRKQLISARNNTEQVTGKGNDEKHLEKEADAGLGRVETNAIGGKNSSKERMIDPGPISHV